MSISVELDDAFEYAEKINVYNEGDKGVYGSDDDKYDKILVGFKEMIDGAHIMPAFGVSLDGETRKELNSGLWVEFEFNEQMDYNEMPFEKLLIKVEENYSGFNLIRYTSTEGYFGRCFYYDLVNKNMSEFYTVLMNL